MKKIISLVIVAVMMVLSLASCDIINDFLETVTKEDNKSGDQSSGDGSENNKESSEGITDAREEVRTTITEDEWEALDDIMNYTAKLTVPDGYKTEDGETGECEVTETIKQTKNAGYVERVSKYDYGETKINEYLYVLKDDVSYELYESDDGTWYATAEEWEPMTFSNFLLSYIGLEDIKFENLVYDEDKKAYTYNYSYSTEYNYTENRTIYFENGTLVKIDLTMTADSGPRHVEATIMVSNIGTTEITVPEYTIESSN